MVFFSDIPILDTSNLETARRIFGWLCVVLAVSYMTDAPARAAGDHGSSCETASLVAPGEDLVAYHDFSGDQDYFRIELVSSGLLIVALADGSAGGRLQLLGMGCGGLGVGDVEYVERSDVRHVLEVRNPGAYYFKVVGRSPSSYELSTTFLPDRPFVDLDVVLPGDAAGDCQAAGESETLVFDADQLVTVTENTDEIDSDIIIIRSTSPGFLEIEAEGSAVLGSLYTGRSCAPEVQLRGDVGLTAGERILLEVPAGEYFLRLAAGPGASGAYRLRIAYRTPGGN